MKKSEIRTMIHEEIIKQSINESTQITWEKGVINIIRFTKDLTKLLEKAIKEKDEEKTSDYLQVLIQGLINAGISNNIDLGNKLNKMHN